LCSFSTLIPKLGVFFEKGVKKTNNNVTVLTPYVRPSKNLLPLPIRACPSFRMDFHSRSWTSRLALVFMRVFSTSHSSPDPLHIRSNNANDGANDVDSAIELILCLVQSVTSGKEKRRMFSDRLWMQGRDRREEQDPQYK
jgi:hypothetical protein